MTDWADEPKEADEPEEADGPDDWTVDGAVDGHRSLQPDGQPDAQPDGQTDTSADEQPDSRRDGQRDGQPAFRAGDQSEGRIDSGSDDDSGDPEAPLAGIASSVRDRANRDGETESPSPVDEDRFEEHDVTPLDADEIWNRLEDDDPVGGVSDEPIEERVIEKSAYCERCPFFSTPPDVHCTHDGTTIVELVDVEQFRVTNCPKVRETERLEDL